jgi:hypothetical protein
MQKETSLRLFLATVTPLMSERVGSVPSRIWPPFLEKIHGLEVVHRPAAWRRVELEAKA